MWLRPGKLGSSPNRSEDSWPVFFQKNSDFPRSRPPAGQHSRKGNSFISKKIKPKWVPWPWTLEEILKKPQKNKKNEETQGTLVQPRVFLRTRPYCTLDKNIAQGSQLAQDRRRIFLKFNGDVTPQFSLHSNNTLTSASTRIATTMFMQLHPNSRRHTLGWGRRPIWRNHTGIIVNAA